MKAFVLLKESVAETHRKLASQSVQSYLAAPFANLEKMLQAEQVHRQSVEQVLRQLEKGGVQYIAVSRSGLPGHAGQIDSYDIAISVGGDGTFLDLAHFVRTTPLLGVNSDPERSTGNYCTATAATIADYFRADAGRTSLSRIQAAIGGKPVPEPVLNEVLFANPNPADMTRYLLAANGRQQEIRSSGLLVCTASGSTAWMRQAGGIVMPLASRALQYHSRDIGERRFEFAEEVAVTNLTAEARIFIDGKTLQYEVPIGNVLHLKEGNPLTVVGKLAGKYESVAAREKVAV